MEGMNEYEKAEFEKEEKEKRKRHNNHAKIPHPVSFQISTNLKKFLSFPKIFCWMFGQLLTIWKARLLARKRFSFYTVYL